MDKKEMLQIIEQRELRSLQAMNMEELRREVEEWFGEPVSPMETREELYRDYLEDFMRYRESESEEELLAVIENK